MRAPLTLVLPLCGVLACDGPDGPLVTVQMHRNTYVRSGARVARVTFTVTNRGVAPAHLSGCERPIAFQVEERAGSGWRHYSAAGVICQMQSTYLSLRPGGSFSTFWPHDRPGTYRLRVYYGSTLLDPHPVLSSPGQPFELR